MVRFRLFGYPAAEVGGAPVSGPAAQRHRLALLALLALAPRRTVSRAKLLALLWPEADTASARHLLNVAVHALRDGLGRDAVQSDRDEVTLSAAVEVDVATFLDALAAAAPERAVAVYRGPLLDGFSLDAAAEFEYWVERERARLAALHRDALQSLARAADHAGDRSAAVRWWRALVHEDPLNTGAVAALMLALERSGDRGNAIQLAQEHEAVLRRELETEPDEGFQALVRRLRRAPAAFEAADPRSSTPAAPPASEQPRSNDGDGASVRPAPAPVPAPAPWPRRRALWATAAMATAGITVAAVAMAGDGSDPELVARRAVVSHFENRTGDPALEPVGFMVADWITRGMLSLGLGEVVSSDEALRSTLALAAGTGEIESLGRARALALEARARYAITGSYYRRGDSLAFQAQIIDARDGRVLRAIDEVRVPAAALESAATSVRDRLVGGAATLLDERTEAWSDRASQPPSLEAYRRYAAGMDAFLAGAVAAGADRQRTLDLAAEHFRAAAADSSFTAPLVWGVYAHWNGAVGTADDLLRRLEGALSRMAPWDRAMAEHVLAHSRGDFETALAAARRAVEYSPDSEWRYKAAYAAARLNRPGEALDLLEPLDPDRGWMKWWPGYWSVLGQAHHLRAEYAAEVAAGTECRRRHPGGGRWSCAVVEFGGLVGVGQIAAAVALAREAGSVIGRDAYFIRELRLHRHDSAAAALAREAAARVPGAGAGAAGGYARFSAIELLLEAGRLNDAHDIAAAAAFPPEASPDTAPDARYAFALRLAAIAALRGDRPSADRADRLLRRLEPHLSPGFARTAWLGRAELLAERGERDSAVAIARGVLDQGSDLAMLLHGNSRLTVLLRDHPDFQRLMRPRG